MFDSAGLEILDPAECLRLLEQSQIGRIVFTEKALPAVRPVTYKMHNRAIVIATGGGSKLVYAAQRSVVAFEIDDISPELDQGWSVTTVGHAEIVTDPDELRELESLSLKPWSENGSRYFIRVSVEMVQGRRLHKDTS